MKTNKLLLTGLILTTLASSAMAANEEYMSGKIDDTSVSPYSFIKISNTHGTGIGQYTEQNFLKPNQYMGTNSTYSVVNVMDQGGFHAGSSGTDLANLSPSGVNVFQWGSMTADYTADGVLLYSIKQNITNPTQTFYDLDGTGIRKPEVKLTLTEMKMGNNILHDVKAGEADTDAVNVSQLKDYVAKNTVDTNTITTVVNGDNTTVTAVVDTLGNKEYKVNVNKDLTDMNSAVFKDDSTNKSRFNPIVYTPTTSTLDKRGETKIDGSVIQLHGPKENTDFQEQVTSLTGKELRFVREGDYQTIFDINGIDIIQKDTGALLGPGKLMVNGYEDDDDTKTYRELEFSATKVDVGGQQIHGVTAGTEDTDAVNVSQLKEVKQLTVDNKKVIENHEGRIGDLENKITNVGHDTLNQANNYTDSQVAKVGASAAALSALHPLDYNPDHKTDIMAGVGHYKGKTAVALGVAYRPNENVLLSLGTTINGKDTMVNAGVSYKVGAKDSTYRSPASMAKDIDDLKAIVNKLVEENKQLREQVNSK